MIDWTSIIRGSLQLPDHKIQSWREYRKEDSDNAREALINLRRLTLNSRVIHLSDDLVWAVTKLSFQLSPQLLLEAALTARMPFPNTLFTWDSNVRSAAYKDEGARVLDPSPAEELPAMVVSSVQRGVKVITDLSFFKKKLNIFPIAFWFDPELSMNVKQQTQLLRRRDITLNNSAEFSPHVNFFLTTAVALKHLDFARELETDRRFGTRIVPPIGTLSLFNDSKNQNDTIAVIMSGTAGNPRWLGALCALMNYQSSVPKIVRDVPAGTSNRKSGTASTSTWTLYLPRQKVISQLTRHLKFSRKPAGKHEVTGFWTTSKKHGDPSCKHKWPEELTRRQVCLDCGALRWWKNTFERGNGPLRSKSKRRLDYSGVSIAQVKAEIEEQLS